jgi:hypothetical protein
MDEANTKTIEVLTATIARAKADLNARMKHLDRNDSVDSADDTERRPGRLYNVFRALND